MTQPVVIKANNFGILVVLDGEIPFNELITAVKAKFSESRKFLGSAEMALGFEGRDLSVEEESMIISAISESSDLKIMCVLDKDEEREKSFKKAIEDKVSSLDIKNAIFYKGSLRSGQVAEFETGVIVMGDINPGANIVSKGSIVVLGSLKGTAVAGQSGNENAFIFALDMKPMQLRIADYVGRAGDDGDEDLKTAIAYAQDGGIYIDSYSKNVLANIKID